MNRRSASYEGLFAAVFSPMHPDGSLNLDLVGKLVEHLIRSGVRGMYICGSTGEGPTLTSTERMSVARAYIEAAQGRLVSIVQVGHESLAEAKKLAEHAALVGADAISAVPPTYFPPRSEQVLVDCLGEIASGAPNLPLFYYHIPEKTGVRVDLLRFLQLCESRLPSLVGVKYSTTTVYELQQCIEELKGRITMMFGCDEMLLSGLCAGARGAVGSTYNFAAPLYRRILTALRNRELDEARRWQGIAAQMVRIFQIHGGAPAIKGAMALLGLDCGPVRLPQQPLSREALSAMRTDLERIGFFEWIHDRVQDGEEAQEGRR